MNKFINFEGIDRSGKSSLSNKITDELNATYFGRCAKRDELNKLGPSERFKHYWAQNFVRSKEIEEALKKGNVVNDRYFLSTLAYHNTSLGKRLEEERKDIKDSIKDLYQPDITFLTVADRKAIEQRFKEKPAEHQYENIDYLIKVQEEFKRLINFYGKGIVIDTSKDSIPQSLDKIRLHLR